MAVEVMVERESLISDIYRYVYRNKEGIDVMPYELLHGSKGFDLLYECRDGKNPETYNLLFYTCRERLLPVAQKKLGNYEDAEEIFDDAFHDVTRIVFAGRYESNNFTGYLYRTLINKCITFLKARNRSPMYNNEIRIDEHEDDFKLNPCQVESYGIPDCTTTDDLEDKEAQEIVGLFLRKLPPMRAAAVALKYIDEYEQSEIATMLEIPIGTVQSGLRRGLLRLEEILKRPYNKGLSLSQVVENQLMIK